MKKETTKKKKTKKKKHLTDPGFEEFKRLGKMWKNREKFAKKKPEELEWREHQMLAQKIFEDGNKIEAFIVLHGLIEMQLNEFWICFMFANGIFNDPRVEPKPRTYSLLTEVLYEAGLLEQDTHQNLTDFNAHRNLLSHNIFGIKKKKNTKKETKVNFEKGLLASGTLPVVLLRYFHVEGKKNPKFKKVIKKVYGF